MNDIDALADLIAEERDKYPRVSADMDSGELAEIIADSEWLAGVKAAVWDEGHDAARTYYGGGPKETNPYAHNGFDHCPSCQAVHQAKGDTPDV